MLKSAWVIESLKPDEGHFGESLGRYLTRVGVSSVKYRNPQTLAELQDVFAEIQNALHDPNNSPLAIQFVCHGCDDGIFLAGQTLVEWEKLRTTFREIYVGTKKRFHLFMGSCRGFRVSVLIAKHEPCPFTTVFGTRKDLHPRDAKDGMMILYDNFQGNERKTARRMQDSVNISVPPFQMLGYDTLDLWNILATNLRTGVYTDEWIAARLAERMETHREEMAADPSLKAQFEKRFTREALDVRLSQWEKTFKS
jgi:hypothetical protein